MAVQWSAILIYISNKRFCEAKENFNRTVSSWIDLEILGLHQERIRNMARVSVLRITVNFIFFFFGYIHQKFTLRPLKDYLTIKLINICIWDAFNIIL